MSLKMASKTQQHAAHPHYSVWVAASAGSGKTKVLTDRVLNLLLGGCAPERILCLTFTKAAAAEMANRVRDRLGEWAILPLEDLQKSLENLQGKAPSLAIIDRARTLFGLTLDTPGGLKIQTIHSFCQSLLKRFPLEAGLSPFFTVADESQQQMLLKKAFYKVLEDKRHQDLILRFSEQTFKELNAFIMQERNRFREIFKRPEESASSQKLENLSDNLDFLGIRASEKTTQILSWVPDIKKSKCSFHSHAFLNSGMTPPTREESEGPLHHLLTLIPIEALKNSLPLFEEGSTTDRERGRALTQFLMLSYEEKLERYEDYLSFFLTQKGERRACLVTQKIVSKYPGFKVLLEEEALRLEKWLIAYHELEISQVSHRFLDYSYGFLETYEVLKKEHALLDYEDLISHTAALLRNPGCHWVLYKLDGGLDHILVDEAQDTSPTQWQVIRAIAEEFYANSAEDPRNRTLFIVGDGKQSIYSFQGADPEVFIQMQEDLRSFASMSGKTWKDIELSVSFRSTPQILALVDAVFSLFPLTAQTLQHVPARKESVGHVEVWPLIKEEKEVPLDAWRPPLTNAQQESPQKRLAHLIAQKIKGWILTHGPLAKPINPGDILILVRRRTSFVDTLIRTLKEHDIPVAGIDRLWLLETLAVQDLLKIGEFLLLPDDDLTLSTVLKGPLCNLSEEDLFQLAYNRGPHSLWFQLQNHKDHAAVCHILKDLLARVDFLTPFSLFSYILGPLEGRKKWQARLGPESLDSINEFLNLSLSFQEQKTPSLQGFLYWISQEVIELKRDLDQSNQVRVMTVHGSKGLQAPIVFLPDTTQIPQDLPPFDFCENTLVWLPPALKDIPLTSELKKKLRKNQTEEYKRLLYVALTRAEDALYICGWGGRAQETWYDLVTQGMQKVGEEVAFDNEGLSGKGWRLSSKQNVFSSSPKSSKSPAFLLPHWLTTPALSEQLPQVLHPSEGEKEEPFNASDFGTWGTQRGILIHKLLETLPSMQEDERWGVAQKYLENEQIPLDLAHDMIESVRGVLTAYADLFGPQSQSEVPMRGWLNGALLSGQIDRLIMTETHLLCIDFKTHTQVPKGLKDIPQTYIRQMAFYHLALSQIYPNYRVLCGILWTHLPRLDLLPNDLLKKFTPSIDETGKKLYTERNQL